MGFKEIIEQNKRLAPVHWWPLYAYHFTDVSNAVSILESRILYSRTKAKELGAMVNDNASRQVINMTTQATASFVRFYFRPLTPTQYYNEGFKHLRLRYDGDLNANVPVPVFFFFRLEKLLKDPQTSFSLGSEAGRGSPRMQGEAAFSTFDFQKIYSNVPYTSKEHEEKKREGSLRHSEILYPDYYDIEKSLAGIVCRNNVEMQTLLNLLRDKSNRLFLYWQPKIKTINDNQDLYYSNGLFVDNCLYYDNTLSIVFSDPVKRKTFAKYVENIEPVNLIVRFEWYHQNHSLYKREFELIIDYFNAKPINFSGIPNIQGAQEISVKIFLDGNLMCYKKFSVLNINCF